MAEKVTSTDLKNLLKKEEVIIGRERTLKALKAGQLKKVFLASNCKALDEKLISHYAALLNVEVVKLTLPNDEVGLICKKPFSISILSLKVA